MGPQKNCLNEMVLLSTLSKHMLKLKDKKILTFLCSNVLFMMRPMDNIEPAHEILIFTTQASCESSD